MGKCNHDHKKADKWTNIATVGEGISSALSNFYWGVSVANLAYESPEDDASGVPLYVGLFFTVLAIGAMYAHRKVNTYHQAGHDNAEHEIKESGPSNLVDTRNVQLTMPLTEENPAHKHEHQHTHLTNLEKVALGADFITHTGDVSGALTAGADLIIKQVVKNTIPQWGRIILQCGATLFGATSAIANVRTCKNAMLAQRSSKVSNVRISEEDLERMVGLRKT